MGEPRAARIYLHKFLLVTTMCVDVELNPKRTLSGCWHSVCLYTFELSYLFGCMVVPGWCLHGIRRQMMKGAKRDAYLCPIICLFEFEFSPKWNTAPSAPPMPYVRYHKQMCARARVFRRHTNGTMAHGGAPFSYACVTGLAHTPHDA